MVGIGKTVNKSATMTFKLKFYDLYGITDVIKISFRFKKKLKVFNTD